MNRYDLHHLIDWKHYDQSASTLDHLIFKEDLEGRLRAFVLACQTEDLSPRTVEFYIDTIGPFVIWCQEHGHFQPAEITTDYLRFFFHELQKHLSPGGVAAYYRAVKRFFNWMVQERNLRPDVNPMTPIRAPKRPKVIIQPYTEDHIQRMLVCCDPETFHGARNAAIVWVWMDTGLRVSEMVGAQLKDYDARARTLTVIGKGNKQRIVRIGQRAHQAVLRYHKVRTASKIGGGALWVTLEGKALTRWGLLEMVKDLCKRAEISGVRCSPHTFRHFFGTQALRNGADLWQVQQILGHMTLSTTQLYQRTVSSADALPGHDKFSPGDRLQF